MVHSGDQVVWTRGEKLGGGNLVFIGIGIKKKDKMFGNLMQLFEKSMKVCAIKQIVNDLF